VAAVQEQGCWAAFNLTFSDEGQAAVLAAGVEQLPRDAASNHPALAVLVQEMLDG
jgi:hypothetical protein